MSKKSYAGAAETTLPAAATGLDFAYVGAMWLDGDQVGSLKGRSLRGFVRTICVALSLCAAGWSHAQTGVLDQSSPQQPTGANAAWFTLGAGLVWQQQIRAGMSGLLSELDITSGGLAGGTIFIKLRAGAAWSVGPVLAERVIRKAVTGFETHRLDFTPEMSNYSLLMPEGMLYELEVTGVGLNLGLIGTYVNPAGGHAPLYTQPLYYQGFRFMNNGWRIGFRTYVQTRPLCLSDFNSDGGVDGEDIAAFVEAWEGGSLDADVSLDGGVDGSDVYQFFVLWEGAAC